METSGSDAAVTYFGRSEERDYDLEHLPPLLEDEENVSLADVLSLRDSCLSEEEVCAVCAECVLALQSIRPSHLFHTLCITPDTLAFNAHGNVCFMEQLSDDPEGSFVPPEFDNTGSTFEGHVYSLGSTLSAALNFVIEPELEADLGEEIQRLLEKMQEEKPEDRPLLQDILSLSEARLSHTSSAAVCRTLSSAGRRVLSIESVTNFQDGQEGSWEARWQHSKPRCLLKRLSSDDNTKDPPDCSVNANGLSRQQLCRGWDSSLWAEDMDSSEGDGMTLTDELDCRSHNSSPVRRRAQQRLSRVRGALNRSCSVPDSNNPPCLSPPTHGDISIPVSDLTEIGADEHLSCKSVWSNRLQRLNRGSSCESYPYCSSEDCGQMLQRNEDAAETLYIVETNIRECDESQSKDCMWHLESSCNSCQELEMEQDSSGNQSSLNHSLYIPNNHMTKSMLCLNEESQDEWISLRELLTRCGRRLTVNELWALCYTCLSSLQTYIDFPAYLCLDTVYVGCEGEVLFLKPKNIGPRDEFYLAPEYQEHGIVTEKVCVYGVAAILWATAKFSLSPNQKLAMPRKLKRLLLEMAKRTPIERPSIVVAKKSCRDYLSRQGTNAETIWNNLISRVHPPVARSSDAEDLNASETNEESPQNNSGFVPTATESRLAPVPGPVPYSYPVSRELQLPEAFTSTATHFTPIILTNEEDLEEESQHLGDAFEGTVDGLTKSSDDIVETGLDFTPPLEYPRPTTTEPSLHTQELTDSQTVTTTSSTTSSNKMLVDSPSTLPDISGLEVSLPLPGSTNLNGFGVFNNYLFQQDPATGHLSLVPVQVRAPESLFGFDINLSLVPQPLQGLITLPESAKGPFIDCLNVPVRPGPEEYGPPSSYNSGSSIITDSPLENTVPRTYNGQTSPRTQGENQTPSDSISPKVHPALQEVIDLLKGEFSLDGYLDNGHEDIAMGEYIFSLKDLQYHVFASVVKERFSDLYWEDDLLGILHCLVNYSPSTLGSNEQPSSKAVEKAALTPPSIATAWRGKREVCLHGCLDLNGNLHTSGPVAVDSWEGTEARCHHGDNGTGLEDVELRSEQRKHSISEGVNAGSSDSGVMEGGDHSAGGSDESPSEAEFLSGGEKGLTGAHDEQMSPDCSEDMEDSDSVASDRFLSQGSRAEVPGLGFSPAWALAFFGEDCFGPEVIQYAVTLGQHAGSPCLDVKAQELQQQLIIETRNLKKTRNFYQKLIQQERKNKGSESKLMLSKLKSQLEELRSKVVFLDYVKKYLEILSVDQWGLEVSLLPSLAVCGPDSLDIQSSEDTSVLSFGTSKGKTSLQAGSPLGLMAYLYARNAAVEGYIQQFLYTYRFFCTPEQLLQFIMDKFISAAREGPDMSADSERIFHRSLDVLHLWITDCKAVDFTPKSSLVNMLENFLNTEVIPVDSQGESLLAVLHSTQSLTSTSQVRGSLISFDEDDESMCLHLSTEDLSRKWKISRVVEPSASLPKDMTYSIAAALPVPCYGSLIDDLSNVGLRGEERLPFSQNEYSAQHTAQQLTLLQQEIFQGCHPVHFLNSRIQGVRDKVSTPNKNVSPQMPPAEGSSVLVHEGTPSDSCLQRLLTYADSVTNWISAEIVICDSVKTQVALLTKFLWIGKHCYESRNFATAMQVLAGVENVIVRQLPAWKHLASKVCEILEELRAVQVFLKSDDICLMGGEHTRKRPTLPSAHILAMHVQQLEIGAFTLTTGAYKWTKLRSIAKVVSQVYAFQEAAYRYSPDRELQPYLHRRIARFATSDIHLLASDNDANFQQSSERQTRRIQSTLRRVKATFL
ncbi:kinase non-catalytic C-lobe domain-containing protein 1 isoform X1 [Brachyistius frenatus]|uniref:kinase non-catalytic C-lobe domain-containing protein 1 isoform X1 n=1 Tax=Brachyistius frenatus TaxID=100188 RepID=UPI0037E70C5F